MNHGSNDYEALKERSRKRNQQMSMSGRDIGEIPDVVDPERRDKAKESFKFFCETYFANTFELEWSNDHLEVIAAIEKAVLHGGQFALAMPRGSGKTSLCEVACLWAIIFAFRRFVALIGASEDHASEMLESIKTEFETNELLLEDFPEIVYPIHCLDGINNRAAGQLHQKKRTKIRWKGDTIILPTIEGSAASGGILKVAGITGRVRGMGHKLTDGRKLRPDIAILDDPQTDESARSFTQTNTRWRVVNKAVLGLAGPKKKITAIMPCTVIQKDDLADRALNRNKHPDWKGRKFKLIYKFPTNEKLWSEYAILREQSLRDREDISLATAYYQKHQKQMDEGAEVAWPVRFNPDELSAVQYAMNLKLKDEEAFCAEYQNEPIEDDDSKEDMLTADQIAAKVNGFPSKVVPLDAQHLTAFIDVGAKLLWYCVVAWTDHFTGYVLEYGAFPDQKKFYYTSRGATRTLATAKKGAGVEAQIYSGLENLTNDILPRVWKKDDRTEMQITRCLIDANWGPATDLVYDFCQSSAYRSIIFPSHGRYIGAASKPMSEYKKHPGEKTGHNWRITANPSKRLIRYVLFDANYWKTFIHSRFAVSRGDPGSLTLYGDRPEHHKMFAEHLTAEYGVKTEGNSRTLIEWKLHTHKPDNHLFDCMAGNAVAASMLGTSLTGIQAEKTAKGKLKLSELQRARR